VGLRIALVAGVLLLDSKTQHAQGVSDQKLWLEGTGEAELGPHLRLAASTSLRSGADSGVDQFRFDAALGYRLDEHFAFAGRYYVMFRDGYAPLDTQDETRHRVAGDLNVRVRPQRFELFYRLRLQYTTYPFESDHFHLRNKLGAAYAVTKKVAPYVALELIFLASPNAEYRETRFYVGVDWRIKKRIGLDVYYMRQQEENVRMPEQNDILGGQLTYTFVRNKKKDGQTSAVDPD
jgi:hypothetical protein